jgi:hypothetical protein
MGSMPCRDVTVMVVCMQVCQHDAGHAAAIMCSMMMIIAVVCGRAVCYAQHG